MSIILLFHYIKDILIDYIHVET